MLPPPECTPVEVLVCVTLYNESGLALTRTLQGLADCFRYASESGRSDLRNTTRVCVLVDGNAQLSRSARNAACLLGFIDFDATQPPEDDAMTVYVSRLSLAGASPERDGPPIYFAIKHLNRGKLDSHWWFYRRFAAPMNPRLCVQLDVGTVPSPNSLVAMSEIIRRDPSVGAIATRVEIQSDGCRRSNLWAFQHGEFAMQRALLHPAEHAAGYLSVITGQLSAVN